MSEIELDLSSNSANGTTENIQTDLQASGTQNANPDSYLQNASQSNGNAKTYEQLENEYKAVTGKMSSVERRALEAEKKAQTLENDANMFNLINETFAGSPAAYETFRQEMKRIHGQDLGDYNTLYQNKQETQTQSTQVANSNGANISNQNPDIKETIRNEYKQIAVEEQFLSSTKSFVERHPEFDPAKNPEKKEELFQDFNDIASQAFLFQKRNPSMSLDEALDRGLASLYPEKITQEAQKTGELLGKASALASGGNIAAGSGTSSNSYSSSATKGMNQDEREQYERVKARTKGNIADDVLLKRR